MTLLRLVLAAVLVALGWLAPVSAAAAQTDVSSVVHHSYDAPPDDEATDYTAAERGPPITGYANTTYDAVDLWSQGTSARLDGTTPAVTFAYDHHPPPLVQGARMVTSTYEGAGLASRDLRASSGASVAANAGRFELAALGSSRYQTPAGLVYGPGSKHGHRLTHVLQHGFPDATKKTHSVFTSGSGALRTVDEAWLMRGAPDPSDLGK